jgi:hypothetical protein
MVVEIAVETGDKTCPCCNGELHQIGEDKSERLGPKHQRRLTKCHSRLMRRSNQHGYSITSSID